MGNLQGNEAKPSKPAKSPGKANRLMKRRFAKKKDQEFTSLVPEEAEEPGSSTLAEVVGHPVGVSVPTNPPTGADNEHTSSESVYTPAEFAAEHNLCYRSEESVLDPPAYREVEGLKKKDFESEESILDAPEIRNFIGNYGHGLDVTDDAKLLDVSRK